MRRDGAALPGDAALPGEAAAPGPPSRVDSVTRPQRVHHAAGVDSLEGWTSAPQTEHRHIVGEMGLGMVPRA